jgi:beta-carotene 15,15'-dioxygenase
LYSPSSLHQLAPLAIARERERSASTGLLWGASATWVETQHTRLLIVVLSTAILTQLVFGNFDLLQFPVSAAALMICLGAPHGSFDVALLQKRYPTYPLFALLACYIALASGVLLVWWRAPALPLCGFLAIAAVHFGGDWATAGTAARFTLGATVLTATTIRHGDQVAVIFSWLATDEIAIDLVTIMRLMALVLLAVVPVMIWCNATPIVARPGRKLELMTVIMAAVVLPPITFFVLYFCLLHSVRHLIAVHIVLAAEKRRTLLVGAAPYAAAAIAGSAIGTALLSHLNLGAASLTAAFLTLAALTVPHMLLVDRH